MIKSIDQLYPPPPLGGPADLASPTRRFRLHAWAAVAGLILFFVIYFGLTSWFAWFGWRQISRFAIGDGNGLGLFAGIGAVFLLVVMLRGLFFIKRGSTAHLVPCTEEQQPELLAFIRRIAMDVGAPQPRRIFLSERVNASVFHDLAIMNLIFPTTKNLEIGLGAVNVLSLDEFKATIAHELGHFAQRSMTVGRWVHIAGQFVSELVSRRDRLDRFLEVVSWRIVHFAWLAWLVRLLIWSIRSVLETSFMGVIALERALSRQMEFQADLAAVRVSGSDSLVHGLFKLSAADEAWTNAVAFSIGEAQEGRSVADLFAIQSVVAESLRTLRGDPLLGAVPPIPQAGPDRHRLFRGAIAQPPRMWGSHPPNDEREESAKLHYVPSILDRRPAWKLFRDEARLRRDLTRHFLERIAGQKLPPPDPLEESVARLQQEFSLPFLHRRFRGVYLERAVTCNAASVDALYDSMLDEPRDQVLTALKDLYPRAVAGDMASMRELSIELSHLEGLRSGLLHAPGGLIRFRGREIQRRQLPALMTQVEQERHAVLGRIEAQDRLARTCHRKAARLLGSGWEEYLVGLASVMHYAEHTHRRLELARRHLNNTLALATADNRVTPDELEAVRASGAEVLALLDEIFQKRDDVHIPPDGLHAIGAAPWRSWLPEKLDLGNPSINDIKQGWLSHLESYAAHCTGKLMALRHWSLSELVCAEDLVARMLAGLREPIPAPADAPRAPASYRTVADGGRAPALGQLGWWQRFQLAHGVLPSAARFATAMAVLCPALLLTVMENACAIALHTRPIDRAGPAINLDSHRVNPVDSSQGGTP